VIVRGIYLKFRRVGSYSGQSKNTFHIATRLIRRKRGVVAVSPRPQLPRNTTGEGSTVISPTRRSQMKETSLAPNLQRAARCCGKAFYSRRAFNNTRRAKTRTRARRVVKYDLFRSLTTGLSPPVIILDSAIYKPIYLTRLAKRSACASRICNPRRATPV
jgi:hypothetical protein